ncbi:hypothetical protein L4G92_09335 [Neisseria sp. ZJ106]|uniref:Uncharacterized protein n=1 Tax=Neisseria lisongii TaxID=2912188 RepID=A0ABY7RNR5_9NEIS|nr:hypothetical protein [Neisseria lisongii]MCF7522228.1 hypothetical protein [Neisseria lisongii]WCL71870.1 hypothetical protein PJU73_01735 [Neisseria lisongii]
MTSKHPGSKVENPVNSNAAEPTIEQKGQAKQTGATQPTENDTGQSETENKTGTSQEELLEPVDYVILGKLAFVCTVALIFVVVCFLPLPDDKAKLPLFFLGAFSITAVFDGIFRILYYFFLYKRKQLAISVKNNQSIRSLLCSCPVWKTALKTAGVFSLCLILLVLFAWKLGDLPPSVAGFKNYENLIISAIGGLSGSYMVDLIAHFWFRNKTKTENKV